MFMGRPVKPLALAMAMATFTIFWLNIIEDSDVAGNTYVGNFVGLVAGASTALLFAAWWFRSQKMSEWGLLLATGVWISRAAGVVLVGAYGTDPGAFWLSISWAVAAAGAYLIESFDPRTDSIVNGRR